ALALAFGAYRARGRAEAAALTPLIEVAERRIFELGSDRVQVAEPGSVDPYNLTRLIATKRLHERHQIGIGAVEGFDYVGDVACLKVLDRPTKRFDSKTECVGHRLRILEHYL